MRIFQAFFKIVDFPNIIKILLTFLQSSNSIVREEAISLILCVYVIREDEAMLQYGKLVGLVEKLVDIH